MLTLFFFSAKYDDKFDKAFFSKGKLMEVNKADESYEGKLISLDLESKKKQKQKDQIQILFVNFHSTHIG